jgi:polysaccharide pyruvyl transferase WcaK-like protein
MAWLDIVIGQRTHSIINAISVAVPCINISWPTDVRMHGIFGEFLGQSEWTCDVTKLDDAQLTAKVVKLWTDEYERVRSDLQNRQSLVRERALSNGTLLAQMLERRKESKQHKDRAQ